MNKIKKYNLFYKHIQLQNKIYFTNIYNYKIKFILQIYTITKYNLFYKYIQLQNTIYFTKHTQFIFFDT